MDKARSSQSFLFSLLISCVLILAPFYSQQSPGGEGLSIPYNNWVWIFSIMIICSGTFQIILSRKIQLPRYWLAIAALPISFVLSGFFNENAKPTQWLFSISYIIAGFLFFIALFQFQLKRRQIENILYGVCAAAIIHSAIAFCQISQWYFIDYIPRTPSNAPISIFQQVNVHATFLITAFITALYLASSPSTLKRRQFYSIILMLTVVATTAILLAISSRTALVAFIVAVPLIIASRYTGLKRQPKLLLALVIAFVLGFIAGNSLSQGFARYESKIDTQKSHARVHIYDLSWQLFKQAPYFGHGLGRFEKVFQEAKINYENSDKMGEQRFSHPHNEFLYWMIEGGASAIIGILIALLATCLALIKLGWCRCCSYFALIFPISFHTQVELPFYLSSSLWFLWLTLLFIIHSHQTTTKTTYLSTAINKLIISCCLIISSALVGFFVHTTVAIHGITQYLRYPQQGFSNLSLASDNLYYQNLSDNLILTNLLYRDIALGTQQTTSIFIDWAKDHTDGYPNTKTLNDLALAYYYLGEKEKARHTIRRAAKMYPVNASIINRLKDIEANRALQNFTPKIRTHVKHSQAPATASSNDK